jgi:hypothetical protein
MRKQAWLFRSGLKGLALTAATLAIFGCRDDEGSGDGDDQASGSDTAGDAAGSSDSGDSTDTDGSDTQGVDEDAPTWHADIAPVVSESCSGCHRQGGIAPYPFEDYASTAPLAEAIAATVEAGTMPPWGAASSDECTPRFGFKDDISLSPDEITMFRAWAEAGAPEGDPTFAAELPAPPDTELPTVDTTLKMPGSVTIDGASDQFLCFSLDPGLTEERYFNGLQIVPGNDKIVHHVLVYVDDEGTSADLAGPDGSFPCSGGTIEGALLGAWAPGAVPLRTPEDVGMRVPAGSRLVLNVHYHPTGLGPEVDDSTSLQLDWMDETPTFRGEIALVGNSDDPDILLPGDGDEGGGPEFRIPAGASGHVEEMVFEVPDDIPYVRVWSVAAHMHYVGRSMALRFEYENGNEECMLNAPNYSFEWQRLYSYDGALDEMPLIGAGDKVRVHCLYDNSMNNPYVVDALAEQGLDAPVDVYLGEETLDEMCLGVFGTAIPSQL